MVAAAVWPAKDPSEKLDYGVSFEASLARFWEKGKTYTSSTRVRPNRPNGFEYECTTGGQTSHREPSWPTTAAATVTDGTVVWTCRALSTSSLSTTVSGTPSWTAEAGITVTGENISGTLAGAYIESGKDGEDYTVIVTAACADGTTRVKTCVLPVRRAVRVA